MAFVVGENCVKCKFTNCVDICPVDAFREANEFLVIDPNECIDCSACETECPAEAIFDEKNIPEDQKQFIAINAELARTLNTITQRKEPPHDAEIWLGKKNKFNLLKLDSNF